MRLIYRGPGCWAEVPPTCCGRILPRWVACSCREGWSGHRAWLCDGCAALVVDERHDPNHLLAGIASYPRPSA